MFGRSVMKLFTQCSYSTLFNTSFICLTHLRWTYMGKLQFQANRHDCDTSGTEIRTLGVTHNAAASFTGLATRKTKHALLKLTFLVYVPIPLNCPADHLLTETVVSWLSNTLSGDLNS